MAPLPLLGTEGPANAYDYFLGGDLVLEILED